ncbi:MAG: hypothetical protein LBN92_01460 [Treponema sp.]|jgi:hypothetical protein|nr:hypothetical protein [Treponema sp.]
MAISPIDLQTLFTQVDKVGKQESAQREGAAIQQSLQQAQVQQRTEDRIRSVNEAQNAGEGAEAIKDRRPRQKEGGEKHREEEAPEEEADAENELRDPDLGRNIDVTG